MTNKPIEIEVKVKQENEVKSHKFKIFGEISYERKAELEQIPKTPEGYIDYWLIAKQLCKKDGGRLPSMGELALIEALQEMKLLDPEYYGAFWSSSEVSEARALVRPIYSDDSSWSAGRRTRDFVPLCVGD